MTIDQNPAVVASQPDDRKPTKTHYILIIDEYEIIARCTYFTHGITGESEWQKTNLFDQKLVSFPEKRAAG